MKIRITQKQSTAGNQQIVSGIFVPETGVVKTGSFKIVLSDSEADKMDINKVYALGFTPVADPVPAEPAK